ncbi:shikimate dehydrogenase family protein [Lentzea tibetensis]|uniref:shikimate dehydrogenase family protein n=1 Tax=Lentzea tibetensis TaxID=2591470 RepID=UPI001F4570B4|nr:shikimate dehydrogenase [Lentzea tibetensis]
MVVIGDPVAQVRAPALLNAAFARLGVDGVTVPLHVAPPQLENVLSALGAVENLRGVLLTVPHKLAACAFADRRSAAAEQAGSANALWRAPNGRWHAENFDGLGFVTGLQDEGRRVEGRDVALFGAGGAGRAIAPALLDAGAASIAVFDPDEARVDELRTRAERWWPGRVRRGGVADLAQIDVAVNATPLGMRPGDDLPFDPAKLAGGTLVADIVMEPEITRLLHAAAELGLPTHQGIHMLSGQIDHYLSFFGLRN